MAETNTSLVPVFTGTIQEQTQSLCNARDLWQFIESKQDFSTWIKGRIEKYGFTESEDFTVHKFVDSGSRGQHTIDYHLTLDMAKELAMVEANDKGRQVRRYFIACERAAREACVAPKALPNLISRSQAGELATLIAERFPDGKQRPYAWGRFNNHFRLASYKDLPAEQFDAACDYVRQMPRKGESLTGEELPAPAQGEAEQRIQSMLRTGRWLLHFNNGNIILNPVAMEATVMTNEQIIQAIADPGGLFSRKELPEIIHAAAARLKAA